MLLITDGNVQLVGLVAHRLFLQTFVASFLVDEDDCAEYCDLGTNTEERPQCSQLICLHITTTSSE